MSYLPEYYYGRPFSVSITASHTLFEQDTFSFSATSA
jgi:hypothetical protein